MLLDFLTSIFEKIASSFSVDLSGAKADIANWWIKRHTVKNPDTSCFEEQEFFDTERCVYLINRENEGLYISDEHIYIKVDGIIHRIESGSTASISISDNIFKCKINDELIILNDVRVLRCTLALLAISTYRKNKDAENIFKFSNHKDKKEDHIANGALPVYITVKEAADDVREYKKLFDEGIISFEEYDKKRVELLRL